MNKQNSRNDILDLKNKNPSVFQFQQNIVNLHQIHLTSNDLKEYESVYQGAAKDMISLVASTLNDQSKIDQLVAENEKIHLLTERFRVFLGAFLSLVFIIAGCYLVNRGLDFFGIIIILGVALSAFDFRILKFLKYLFKQ